MDHNGGSTFAVATASTPRRQYDKGVTMILLYHLILIGALHHLHSEGEDGTFVSSFGVDLNGASIFLH